MAPATEDELRAAVQHRTHFEAVHALLVARGIRVWTGTSGGLESDPDAARVLLVPYPDPGSEEYATWGTRMDAETEWRHPTRTAYAQQRRDLMAQTMEALLSDPSPNSATRVFTGDHAGVEAHPGARAIRNALVAAWWDRRRAEGHTLDSARTMMRLLVTPGAWHFYDALLDDFDSLDDTDGFDARESVGAACEDAVAVNRPHEKGNEMTQSSAAGPQAGDTVRAKWAMDGATTLEEAAVRLDDLAGWLRDLHAKGWTFMEPVTDDYGILVDPDGNTGHDEDGDAAGDNQPF